MCEQPNAIRHGLCTPKEDLNGKENDRQREVEEQRKGERKSDSTERTHEIRQMWDRGRERVKIKEAGKMRTTE